MTTFETPITVDSNVTSINPNVVKLSSTLAMVTYKRSNTLYARTVTISGTTLTANAEVSVDALLAGTEFVTTALSATQAMVAYTDNAGGGSTNQARVLSVSGTTITVNSPTSVLAGPDMALSTVDSTRALYSADVGGASQSVILSVSGTTITQNTAVSHEGASTVSTQSAVYSSSKAIVTWTDQGGSSTITEGVILNISGNSLTVNTKKTIRSRTMDNGPNATFAIALSGTKVIHGHSGGTNSYLNVLTLNGNTFDVGTETSIATNYVGFTAGGVDSTRFVAIGTDVVGVLTAREYFLSGGSLDQLTADGVDTEASVTNGWCWGAPVDTSTIITAYEASVDAAIITATGGDSDAGTYIIGAAIDNETNGNTGWLTVWKDDVLYLQRWDLPTLTKEMEISLGAATLPQVQAKSKIAYPFAGSDQTMWIFGNMDSPAFLTGTVYLAETTGGGASGTWAASTSLSSWNSTDVLDSLFVSPDQDGIGTRLFTAVRRRSVNAPELWRGLGLGNLSQTSVIPLPTGTGVEYRGMHIGRNTSISLGTDTLGTGSSRIFSAISPYTNWTDITSDFPSGTVQVLRYL